MRAVLQRVTRASVLIDGALVGKIDKGILVLLGVMNGDSEQDVDYLVEKVTSLRIFDDDSGQMNLSLVDVNGELLVVSQFTICGDTRRGRRPSYSDAAAPELARDLYQQFIEKARERVSHVASGNFQAMMQVELVNDGPVTILLDSRKNV